jgi:hypothetical protein
MDELEGIAESILRLKRLLRVAWEQLGSSGLGPLERREIRDQMQAATLDLRRALRIFEKEYDRRRKLAAENSEKETPRKVQFRLLNQVAIFPQHDEALRHSSANAADIATSHGGKSAEAALTTGLSDGCSAVSKRQSVVSGERKNNGSSSSSWSSPLSGSISGSEISGSISGCGIL